MGYKSTRDLSRPDALTEILAILNRPDTDDGSTLTTSIGCQIADACLPHLNRLPDDALASILEALMGEERSENYAIRPAGMDPLGIAVERLETILRISHDGVAQHIARVGLEEIRAATGSSS